MIPPSTRIPFTVIGGFLGAGKTTFLNHLLRQDRQRYTVMVNDFGAVNIDAALIESHDGGTINLKNGCVCCSLADGLSDALLRVLNAPVAPEHIVIEASGVGDPWQIAEVALIEPDLSLAAVIVLVDAEQLAAQLADGYIGDTVRRQISRADLLLLNKMDLVGEAQAAHCQSLLRQLAPQGRILPTIQAQPPIALLHFERDTPPDAVAAAALPPIDGHGIQRWLYRRPAALQRAELERLLQQMPPALLRLKGWCRFAGDDQSYLLQLSGPRWSLSPSPGLPTALLGMETLLVGLGTPELPEAAALDAAFDAILAPAETAVA